MAALLGTNTAFMLFQGIEQERNYSQVREIALTIIAAAIPFQGIYFLIYTFILECWNWVNLISVFIKNSSIFFYLLKHRYIDSIDKWIAF